MDFKANLKGVKPKTEDKVNSPNQVDFRSVLGKKGGTTACNKPAETSAKNASDFRSVLTNKKKLTSPENNSDRVNNCVDGEIQSSKESRNQVSAPPLEFVEKLSDVSVLEGQRLRLECRLATTAADAAVTWTLDGKIIKPSKFIILANEGQRSHTCTHRHLRFTIELCPQHEGGHKKALQPGHSDHWTTVMDQIGP